DDVITEPREIKYEVAQHYEHWTQENTSNKLLREEWAHAFAPKDEIQEQLYNDINQAITVEELSPNTSNKYLQCLPPLITDPKNVEEKHFLPNLKEINIYRTLG
ncbi:9224_t:CDS:2, partial [Gigaspora rosea]